MFKNSRKYANLLNLTEEEFEDFIKRYNSYLLHKNITKKVVSNGFFILQDILEKREEKKKEKFIFHSSKNPKIRKYQTEIIDLYREEKLGETRVSKALFENHRVKITPYQIRYFLQKNGILRGQKDTVQGQLFKSLNTKNVFEFR